MKTVVRDRGALHNEKGVSLQENITFVNIYTPNRGVCKYIKQILTDL